MTEDRSGNGGKEGGSGREKDEGGEEGGQSTRVNTRYRLKALTCPTLRTFALRIPPEHFS